MTLILSYLTQDFVVQVSDRRLTWDDGRLADDNANKATLYCGRAAIGYTGRAQIKTERTDEWLTGILANAKDLPAALDTIKDEATAYFGRIADTPRQRRHAFVIAGWTRVSADRPIQRIFCRVSNFHDTEQGELPEARPEFASGLKLLEPDEPPRLNSTGRGLSEDERLLLGEVLQNVPDPTRIALAMARTVRIVAARDPAVGRGVLAVHIPRSYAEQTPPGQFMFKWGGAASAPFPSDTPGSFYLPADSQELTQHAPNMACYRIGVTNVHSEPIPPDKPH